MNTPSDISTSPAERVHTVRAYHQRTKHHFERYAASPGFMDWATQPDPFRCFAGTDQILLPLRADTRTTLYAELFQPGGLSAQPPSLENVGVLMELSFGLSAWKVYGNDRWALRCNPSSGNLHPTEAYLAVGAGVAGLDSGIYHYQSHDHILERRCRVPLSFHGLLVGLSSIHWREAWKYGERAFRYCQHDVGHALGALRYGAAVLGWKADLLDDWGDADIARLLGLDRDRDFDGAEAEAPDLLCRVGPHPDEPLDVDEIVRAVASATWSGTANILSTHHGHHWPAITHAHEAGRKPRTERSVADVQDHPAPIPTLGGVRAVDLIRQRRSAQSFDGVTAISARALWRMLDATLPRREIPPFDSWPWWPARVHLLLFVHRVEGLPSGLYVLLRHRGMETELRSRLRAELAWETVSAAPAHLPLFRLAQANCQRAARRLSCHQDIAADSAFSLGMLAEFDAVLQQGAWNYRRLFWECGLIGQALYLEAEAAGVRGTGIGCFFDDPVHELLGLRDTHFQSLYHFTVGGPLNDDRLQTLPPYAHLDR